MTRLYIVDQNGLEPGGHYYAYTACVLDGARRLGLETTVLANKRFRPAAAAAPSDPGLVPCFTYTWGEAEQAGKLGWEPGNIAYEMFEAFRRVPPAPDDHVFLHTSGYRELRALLACLADKLPGDPLPYFHLLLRYDPQILIESYRDYADSLALLAASPYLRHKIRLHSDTHLLSAAFAAVCGLPFATAPIPFDQTLLRRSLAARRARQPGEKLTVAYLGDARDEKGYQHLPPALSYLWQDYVAPGRVRFVLQSNFNTPGGEPGILAASQNLAGFLATTLKSEPLQPAEYYEILANADIVLIPYSAQRYRYRSSGVLVEAMGAGKVVVTSAGSWMATQVTPEHAVLFDAPAGLGPAIAEAIDRFEALSAGAEARAEAVLAGATGESLVKHLLAVTREAPSRPRRSGKRVLLVMNGDAMVLKNGASRVAQAQLQYLTAAGHEVVGLFLTYGTPPDAEALAAWRAALARSVAPFSLERVFVAGPASRAFDPDQSSTLRDQRAAEGAPLSAEFDFVAGFEFGGKLLQFLRSHPVDAVLLNYITNYPVVEALGLAGLPVVCEMHDLQSFQRAIYGQRLVDPVDLDEEFKWLARCTALISLSGRETAIVRERLPEARIETTGVFLSSPPLLPSLAGAKDLAEIVSSSGPRLSEYQFEAAWEIGKVESVQRLIEAGSLDLLYVSSAHMANVSGLKWFLSEVYEPYLAQHRVSLIVAGSICRIEDWPQYPRVFYIDQVDDLAPLYGAARVVVLPITEGAGSPVKTFEAMAYGRPIVGTAHAFRGIDGEVGGLIIRDEPRTFADAVLDLINSEQERRQAAENVRRAAARGNDFARYFGIMDEIFGPLLGGDIAPTPPPTPAPPGGTDVEWSPSLQALNRAVRSYLDGEPLEGWALVLLAQQDPEEVDALLDRVSRSLLESRDAAVLQTEQRLKRYVANSFDTRLLDETLFVVRLAIAERRGATPARPAAGAVIRAAAFGGLPLTVAGSAGEAGAQGLSLRIGGRDIAARRVAVSARYAGRTELFQAEIPALEKGTIGLRAIELAVAATGRDGAPGGAVAVLRHSIPIAPDARLLERDVFGGGFAVRADGSADLPPGATGLLSLPRVADGLHPGFVDLCFAGLDPLAAESDAVGAGPAVSVTLGGRPADSEAMGGGRLTLARVFLAAQTDIGEFGVVSLAVANKSPRLPLRLVAVHSGLLVGTEADAARTATVLALAGQRWEQASYPRLTALAREAIGHIIGGAPPGPAALDALCALSASATGQDSLRALVSQELARASRQNGAARDTHDDTEAVVEDVYAIVAGSLGTGDPATAVFCPALPFAVVDAAGATLPAATELAMRQRTASWRVPMPRGTGERIGIRLDARLEIPGHPGLIGFSNFYPAESPSVLFRWTGPEPTSTIALPLVLNMPARLVIELASTGRNGAREDFTLACNGKPVTHSFEIDTDNIARLTAELPAARVAGPSTEIALTVKECFRPEPPDRRILGVVFRSLSLLLGGPGEAVQATSPAAGGEPPSVSARPAGKRAAAAPRRRPAGREPMTVAVPRPDLAAGEDG